MRVRSPAAAGTFYPSEAEDLKRAVSDSLSDEYGPRGDVVTGPLDRVVGAIVPHAGYVYSGPVACHSYAAISSSDPELFIIIGPNHWGLGRDVATASDCTWETPLGVVEVDSAAARELGVGDDGIAPDFFAHAKEHSIEVQVPMLQALFREGFKILPISMTDQEHDTAVAVGRRVARVARSRRTMVLGSSDLTHYEPNEFAHAQDAALVETMLHMDVEGFYRVLEEKKVTACGYGAIAAAMIACSELGASRGTLLRYATSGDVSGETDSVVGYASVVFH